MAVDADGYAHVAGLFSGAVTFGEARLDGRELYNLFVVKLGVVQSPTLRIVPSGQQVVLSWRSEVASFVLQWSPSLTEPVTWIDSLQTPSIVGDQYIVIEDIPQGTAFYRLEKR